ncbi:hypothetical protein NKI38_08470 [Mesorhizobium sp. M0621]|uniref:SDH family Clp fold serine proteinase n=1 Tax=Mesorhizobium sp. M0621 TaxID=2956974 RepID=UPI003335507F
MGDLYLYNGPIERGSDLKFIELVASQQSEKQCVLILVTGGGSPDAAYKIGRYLQSRYDSVKVLISGLCKSAGTLLAIAADELIFTPYGELGPLDVQMAKEDRLLGYESGLNISEAFLALEQRAKGTYHDLVSEIVTSSSNVVSFNTASHAATEIISALYGPIFHRIDPEEVGSRSRAMRIGEDYGQRLNGKWQNLKNGAIEKISQSYPSHGFVIDIGEAQTLFQRVRAATPDEIKLVEGMGRATRFPQQTLAIRKIEPAKKQGEDGENHDAKVEKGGPPRRRAAARNGADSGKAVEG